jgi:hypothetical protein
MSKPKLPFDPVEALETLFKVIGSKGVCKSENCGEPIWWVTTRHGRRAPVNAHDGRLHWLTCPDAPKYAGTGRVSVAMGKTKIGGKVVRRSKRGPRVDRTEEEHGWQGGDEEA